MWGPVSYFLFARVDILLAFSCGIMIKPDSILLSLCCIISMGQYFWYYQCNLEYLLGVCVCIYACVFTSVLLGGYSMFKAGWREPKLQVSNKYVVPPCVRWRTCRCFAQKSRNLHVWIFVYLVCLRLLLSCTCRTVCFGSDKGMQDVALGRQNKFLVPLMWRRPWWMWVEIFCLDERWCSDRLRAIKWVFNEFLKAWYKHSI